MTEWTVRALGALLLGLVAVGMSWKLRRDVVSGIVKRRDQEGRDLETLVRSKDPAAFRRHVVMNLCLIAMMVGLVLIVMLVGR